MSSTVGTPNRNDQHSIQISSEIDDEAEEMNIALQTLLNHQRRLIQEEQEDPEEERSVANNGSHNNNSQNVRNRVEEARRLIQVPTGASAQVMNFAHMWRRGNFVYILYFIPLTVALVTVLLVDWNKPCDRPLRDWAATQVALQFLLLAINLIVLNKLPSPDDPADVQEQRIRSLSVYFMINRILNLVWFIWFIVGMVWTFEALGSGTCSRTAPFLFRMCYALVVIQLVLIGLVVLFCCCSCLVVLLRLFVYPPGSDTRNRGATERAIKALPTKKFEASQIPKDDSNCAICLSDYETGEEIRFLPCNHHFHSGCVDQWLLTNKTCPFCKREIDAPPAKNSTSTTATETA